MKFNFSDRIIRLGITPVLCAYLKENFAEYQPALWQRMAKHYHRELMSRLPEVPASRPYAANLHSLWSLACLLIGFHRAAPDEADFSVDDFDAMVELSARSIAIPLIFKRFDFFSATYRQSISKALEHDFDYHEGYCWCGTLSDSAAGDDGFNVTIRHCGFAKLLVEEKRFFLLKSLCTLEELVSGFGAATLERTSSIALGAPACQLELKAVSTRNV